jgi:putative chitinase
MITVDILQSCLPQANPQAVELFAEPISNTCDEFDISTPERVAAFVAQCGHESGNLKYVKENLNYSAQGLCKVFPKYFNTQNAMQYERNPEAIANRVYANRMGNGSEESGDGWAFRGRGLIQLTGKTNYEKCGQGLGLDLISDPMYLESPEGAARSAGWFWHVNKLNILADSGDIKTMTKKINGGFIGLEDRIKHYEHILHILRN